MKYLYLFLILCSFWAGRQSVNSEINFLKRNLENRTREYEDLSAEFSTLEKKITVEKKSPKKTEERLPASAVVVKSVPQVEVQKNEPKKEDKKQEKEKDISQHLEKVMRYVQYLNESDSGTIIEFLKKQKAPDQDQFKKYNEEIETTISKVPVRCEARMADCFETGEDWQTEQEEVVFCATQFSRCLKSDQYKEITPSEFNNLVNYF